MNLPQLHYTSAPPGPDGSGFRFTAVSPGVPPSVLREVEQFIGYEPPRDAPPRPTDSQLDLFPRGFSHSLLGDGSRLIARTIYTGADYSGRWGNFHVHAVHLPTDVPLTGKLPIAAWESTEWATATPPDTSPAPLRKLPASGCLEKERLTGFAVSRAPWLPGFFADVRRLTEDADAPQLILVEQDSSDVALWVALASAALPRESAHRLTFTTYTRRPQLARQQIIGVLPDDAQGLGGHDHRYRVHDCTGRHPAEAEHPGDAWAETASQVWLGGAPDLFRDATAVSAGAFAAGPLAAVALCHGLTLGARSRTAAAEWAQQHLEVLAQDRLRQLIEALCASCGDRTATELAALTRLFTALEGRVTGTVIAPLAALTVTEAVRAEAGRAEAVRTQTGHTQAGHAAGQEPVLPRREALTGDLRQRLAAELGSELRAGVAQSGTDGRPERLVRPVRMLRIAELLGVDCTDLLPELARRLARSLFADPDGAYTPDVRAVLEEQLALRAPLLEKLDALAAGDPRAGAALVARTRLRFTAVEALPHLRMCAEAELTAAPGGDGVDDVTALLQAGKVSPASDPLALRTAMRLVWGEATPSAAEARRLLDVIGPDIHRAAGTWQALLTAALASPADDPEVPGLAVQLLRCSFPGELQPRERGALLLLEFAGRLDARETGPGWVDQAAQLLSAAKPVEPAVLSRCYAALAHRLLELDCPDAELRALIHSGEPDLISAYARAAGHRRVRNHLRVSPAYVADCFAVWTSYPQAGKAWNETRKGLLQEVLRPIVRALPAEDLTTVERVLERKGGGRADAFRTWHRPRDLSRLGLGLGLPLGARRRRKTAREGPREGPPREGPARGDVEPPRRDGRSS